MSVEMTESEFPANLRGPEKQSRPRPPPHKYERKLSKVERDVLETARQGKRDPETMAGWTFRLGLQGLAGSRSVQVKPWNHDTWLWVCWCPSALKEAPKLEGEKAGTGFDRL